MAFAIMRCKKLKGLGGVAASLKHCFREQETPNADPARTGQNDHAGAKTTADAMGKLKALLPAKRRKDAVLAVEYMMSASPDWWKTASKAQQLDFFNISHRWLAEKFGRERIIVSTIHRDETSPHLSAYVVPLTADGRLSAKELIGDRHQLSQDQTTYAQAVAHLGLERGLEGSKARHTTIREYYTRVNAPVAKLPQIELPEPNIGDRLKPAVYAQRVKAAVLKQLAPTWNDGQAKAKELNAAKVKEAEARDTVKRLQKRYGAFFQALDDFTSPDAKKRALDVLDALNRELQAEWQEERQLAAEIDQMLELAAYNMQQADITLSAETAMFRAREMSEDQEQHAALRQWLRAGHKQEQMAPDLADPANDVPDPEPDFSPSSR